MTKDASDSEIDAGSAPQPDGDAATVDVRNDRTSSAVGLDPERPVTDDFDRAPDDRATKARSLVEESADATTNITRTEPAFRIHLNMQLTLTHRSEEVAFYSSLLGWKNDAFLICELPFPDRRAAEIMPGSRCIVRYVLGGRVMGFVTRVLRSHFAPGLLLLEYPAEAEQVSLRRHPRYPVHTTAVVRPVGALKNYAASMLDLSLSGCRLAIADISIEYNPGMEVLVMANIPGVRDAQKISAAVRNVVMRRAHGADQPTGVWVGLEFVFDRDAPQRRFIAEFLEQRKLALGTLDLDV